VIKKIIYFLALFGILALFNFSASVIATNQPINATINENVIVSIMPGTIEFGDVNPGDVDVAATNGPIIFSANGSNANVTISITNVTGFPFATGLMIDAAIPSNYSVTILCTIVADVCTYTDVTAVPTLSIPAGAPVGDVAGAITYLIQGPA